LSEENASTVQPANVEVLREVIEAFRARDWARMRELLDPSFEYHTSDQFPEGSEIYRGPAAMERVRAFLDNTWAEAEVELREAIPAGDAVFAVLSGRLSLARSGVALPAYDFFQVWTFADQRPVRARSFEYRADALKAAGLEGAGGAIRPEARPA
jgi:ketosteroid isomerase-like protein